MQELKSLIDKGDKTIYTQIRHRAKSGMSRIVSCYYVIDGKIADISYMVSEALGAPLDKKHRGLKVRGCDICDINVCFWIAVTLSSKLGYKIEYRRL